MTDSTKRAEAGFDANALPRQAKGRPTFPCRVQQVNVSYLTKDLMALASSSCTSKTV